MIEALLVSCGMFGLFEKSKPYKVIDKVWISNAAKLQACAAMLKANPQCVFIAWFAESAEALKAVLNQQEPPVYLAENIGNQSLQGKLVMFIEHYPLAPREEAVFHQLRLPEIPVLSGLDEPLLMHFGGERTIEIMKRLGAGEDEPIGHAMITKSIRNAQKKLGEKVKSEQHAASAQQWFARNLP